MQRHIRYAVAITWALSLVASCSASSTRVCTSASDCLVGQSCVDRTCIVRTDAGGGDAALVDARPIDGGALDSGPPVGFGRRCDATMGCPAGLRCVDGACHLDCGAAPFCGSPELCCAMGQVCGASGCAMPGAACNPTPGCGGATTTCATREYCDAVLMRCLPSPTSVACTLPPAGATFSPELMWHWTGSHDHPSYRGVLVTPMVADVNHDGASDVLVIAYEDAPLSFGGTIPGYGILCALSGPGDCATGPREIFCTDPADTAHLLNSWGHLAVADLDATDARDELTIVAGLHRGSLGGSGVVAYDEHGRVLWVGHDAAGAPVDVFYYGGAPAIADLDADGHAEIIVGGTVFDSTGRVVWASAVTHSGNAGFGPISVVVDLDADGSAPEIVTGNTAYSATGAVRWTSSVIGDGYPGVADFDADGRPEIVVVYAGRVAVLRADGTTFAGPLAFSSLTVGGAAVTGNGGAPTLDDVDGDGRPEIGFATANAYVVLRVTARTLSPLWTSPVNDASSNITASAMFDFDGSGHREIIYQDTCRTRVYAGMTGAVLMDIPNSSGTATNYPTVADLNGDGRAEFILVADSFYARTYPTSALGCPAGMPLSDGVLVYRDQHDNWQSTRAIWNQHSYHVTNVCDGSDSACMAAENHPGSIPRAEIASWTSASIRGYRINARFGPVDRSAPDVAPVAIAVDVSMCPAQLTIRADVTNRGAAAVAAGAPVSFYDGDPRGAHTLLGTVSIPVALPPGGVARVTLTVPVAGAGRATSLHIYVVVNDDGTGMGRFRECDTMNNTSRVLDISCGSVG